MSTSLPDILRIAAGNFIGSFVAAVVIAFFGSPAFPRSLYALDFLLCLLATASIRVATRMVYEAGSQWKPALGTRTLIYVVPEKLGRHWCGRSARTAISAIQFAALWTTIPTRTTLFSSA